jgi:hypothetical protein
MTYLCEYDNKSKKKRMSPDSNILSLAINFRAVDLYMKVANLILLAGRVVGVLLLHVLYDSIYVELDQLF